MLTQHGLNRFPIWPATFARSAAHAQYRVPAVYIYLYIYIYIYLSCMTARPLSPQDLKRGLAHARPNYMYIYMYISGQPVRIPLISKCLYVNLF